MIKKFIGLSGLPRTGSTLLSAILDQNPDIHAEGNSAVCQLMWDTQQSCEIYCNEQLSANNRLSTKHDIVSAIPNIYYKDTNASIVMDKCRSWTLPDNLNMLYKYISDKPKIIVLERPVTEIMKSFVFLREQNNYTGDKESDLLAPMSDPIMRSLEGIEYAKNNNNGEFLFISYYDIVMKTKEVIKNIYEFCEIDFFKHNLDNIINNHQEDDSTYNLIGQHEIRPSISCNEEDMKTVLSEGTLEYCKYLDKKYGLQ
jgi:sulfotransferase